MTGRPAIRLVNKWAPSRVPRVLLTRKSLFQGAALADTADQYRHFGSPSRRELIEAFCNADPSSSPVLPPPLFETSSFQSPFRFPLLRSSKIPFLLPSPGVDSPNGQRAGARFVVSAPFLVEKSGSFVSLQIRQEGAVHLLRRRRWQCRGPRSRRCLVEVISSKVRLPLTPFVIWLGFFSLCGSSLPLYAKSALFWWVGDMIVSESPKDLRFPLLDSEYSCNLFFLV
ncbi:hypothetical protein B296_00011788 [Ensete ventricosum]|uniref:Uncharacterized protein n=1 Tax=Ensete ventricosum TaxID=4639 RepID=A0A427AML0_ENSVE|nr:hypothetical protein B296_00011788 [Ensete ventricosum]